MMDFVLKNLGKAVLTFFGIVLLFLVIKNFAKIKKFVLEVKAELTKVSWSSRQELMGSTVVVIAVTAIIAVYIGVIDVALSKILSVVFK